MPGYVAKQDTLLHRDEEVRVRIPKIERELRSGEPMRTVVRGVKAHLFKCKQSQDVVLTKGSDFRAFLPPGYYEGSSLSRSVHGLGLPHCQAGAQSALHLSVRKRFHDTDPTYREERMEA
jgi:hypothetical protein